MGFGHVLQMRHRNVADGRQAHPQQQDRHGKPADGVRQSGRRMCGRSCGLHQAEGIGVHCVDDPFVLDFTIHSDATAQGIAIALRHKVAESARLRRHHRQRPRQGRVETCCG